MQVNSLSVSFHQPLLHPASVSISTCGDDAVRIVLANNIPTKSKLDVQLSVKNEWDTLHHAQYMIEIHKNSTQIDIKTKKLYKGFIYSFCYLL